MDPDIKQLRSLLLKLMESVFGDVVSTSDIVKGISLAPAARDAGRFPVHLPLDDKIENHFYVPTSDLRYALTSGDHEPLLTLLRNQRTKYFPTTEPDN